MTDLQQYVDAPGRDDLVKQVRAKIDELGITYVYYQFISVTGRIVGKGIPARHWERTAAKGFQLVYGSTANLAIDRHGEYIGYGPEASELVGIADPDTFVQLPWDKRVARVFCTLFRNREERVNPGQFLSSDCRGNLRRIHEEFKGKHGLEMRCGTEPEMMWLKKGEDGQPDGGVTKPTCYHIDQFEELRPVFMRVIEYSEKMGLDIIQGDHEDAPGQLELNTQYDDVLQNADRLTTYRQICAQVAREFGLIACFMSKPFMGVSASGCHHNMSLWSGGENVCHPEIAGTDSLPGMPGPFTYREGGHNTFMPVPEIHASKPGPIGLQCIGGVIAHLPALTSIGSSTVNSYRRLWDTGFWAPIFADWGYQNRTCALRVSAPGRFEYRSVDSMVNPYLMGAALLKAFDDGMDNDLDPGDPEERNIYAAMEAGKQVKKLPMSLGDAMIELENDATIKSSMPGEMYTVYSGHKNDEWERFNQTVTNWDTETYLDCLP
ncbi:glutamine synthetase family protein [Candidatus Njordibacter sp. Uisw_002]|jgi:glutamine synthetase|uniref:glutamine synthetase family protein n=1 Tax=Candidatus Njordibacter sp. Uisw_002 TaxID=3230971 RepID=UPI003D48C23E|tara:strand:- start:8036 stop:9511 length:1476 start_codon:yes stop_codon:yes gene_type:complete